MLACALQFLHKSRQFIAPLDPSTIEDIAEAFSFGEIRKKSIQTRFCSALCDTVSDKDLLLKCGGIIIPMARMTLYLTFAPTADVSIINSLPKELRLALTSHKKIFYHGGLVLSVASSIFVPPAYLFQFALLTLLCPEQSDQVPAPTERPRKISDAIANIAPLGHAPWLPRLISSIKEDPSEGARPLPWTTPSLAGENDTLTWTSSGNSRSIKANTTLAFCP